MATTLKANLSMAGAMGRAASSSMMAATMKEISKIMWLMVMASTLERTGTNTKANGKITFKTALANVILRTVDTLVNSLIAKDMVKELCMRMGTSSKETLSIARLMAMRFWTDKMASITKEHGNQIYLMEMGYTPGLTEANIEDSILRENEMVKVK